MDQFPQHMTSISSIGPITGAINLAKTGNILRFATLEKLVAFASIDPTIYQSSQFAATQTRMSKRGSAHLGHTLWQAAFMSAQYDPQQSAFYQRKWVEGKAHGTTVGAVCRKLLHRIYVVLKEQCPDVIRDQLLGFGLIYYLTFYCDSFVSLEIYFLIDPGR